MISVATVRHRWAAFLGAFLAVAVGVTVVTTSALVMFSGGPGVPRQLAGAPVLVHSQTGERVQGALAQSVPWEPRRASELRQRLSRLPGVRQAVLDRPFYAQAVGSTQEKGELRGRGWSSAALASAELASGAPPRADDEMVVDQTLGRAPGDFVTVLTASGTQRFTVSGTVRATGQSTYYVTDRQAATLAGGARVIGLLLAPGADASQVAADAERIVGDDGTVLHGADRTALAPAQDEWTRWVGSQVLTAMVALSVFVTVFVVSATFAFTVAQRRQEFGLLRVIGATPRQVRRMVWGEALAIGAAGSAAGVLLGLVLAPTLAGVLVDVGLQPAGFTLRVRPWVPAVSFVLGPLVALAGVWTASRRAARTTPVEAMAEAAVDDRPTTLRRRVIGAVAVTFGLGCAVATAFSGADAMVLLGLGAAMGLTVGLSLLAPALLRPVVTVLTRPLARSRGATALLVRQNVLTSVRRSSAVVAPVLATVTFAVLITSTVLTTQSASTAQQAAAIRAQAAVVPHGTPGLSEAAVASVEGTALLSTTVYDGPSASGLPAAGVSADFAKVHAGPAPRSGTAVVSRAASRAHGWPRGATAVLTLEDGRTARLRVVAVMDEPLPYDVLLPRDLVRAHDPTALTDVVYRTGSSPARPASELGAREVTVAEHAGTADAEENRLIRIFTLLLVALSAGYTTIATASTVLLATADRRPDLRLLRRAGATPRQVLRCVAVETCCLVALGAALGLAAAGPALLGMVHGLRNGTGLPVELLVSWPWVAGSVAGCALAGLLASVLPARVAVSGGR